MNNLEKLKKNLEDNQIPHTLHNFESAFPAIGAKFNEGLATLLFKSDNEYIVVLRRDDRNIDSGKLKKLLKIKSLNICTEKELDTVGFRAGAVSPLLLENIKEAGFNYRVVVDSKALDMDRAYTGSGSDKHTLEIKVEDILKNIGKHEVLDFTVPNPKRPYRETVRKKEYKTSVEIFNLSNVKPTDEYFKSLIEELKRKNIEDIEFIKHKALYDVDEYINDLGLEYKEGLSTLIFKSEKGYIGIYRRDDRKIDIRRLKEILKVKTIEPAAKDDVKKNFNFDIRAVGILHKKLSYIMDKSLLEQDYIYGGVGDPQFDIKITPKDLLKLSEARVENFTLQSEKGIKRVLSGLISSGKSFHIGNYFGAIKPQMDLQDKVETSYYFIADLHSLTSVRNKEIFVANTTNIILDYIALGLKPEKSAFFRQSDVPAHCQLAIVLANYIPYGYLKRMHAFKDRIQKGVSQDSINMGLFNYPILQAADILLYKPGGVPVGEDQRQHVELSQTIAKFFNKEHKINFFPIPKPLIEKGDKGKVIGTDGDRKMSKSIGNVIDIFGDYKKIESQIMSCYTDPNRIKASDPGKVKGNPIFIYHDLINDNTDEVNDLKGRYLKGTVGDVEVKKKLIKAHQRRFAKAREKRKQLEENIDLAKDILSDGTKRANIFANNTLDEVYDLIGINNELSFRKKIQQI